MESAVKPVSRPHEVGVAISIEGVNVFLGNALRTLSVALGILSGRIAGPDVVFKSLDEIVIWGCSIGLLAFIWSGANWARWLNLALGTLNIGLFIYAIVGSASQRNYVAIAIPIVCVVLEAIAQYILFFTAAAQWFNRKEETHAA